MTTEELFWNIVNSINSIKVDKEKYPCSTFFLKDKNVLFQYDSKNKYLFCSSKHVWSIFEKEQGMKFGRIQDFITWKAEEHFNCKGVTVEYLTEIFIFEAEEHFNCKV